MSGRGLILGIETSCDETAAAVVERGARTLSSLVSSQIATHARYGGVVPELASREHLRAIVPVARTALAQAGVTLPDLDAIAVTSGPGLAGALLVGIAYAKALAFAQKLPLIAVNHLEGHIHAVLLNERSLPDGRRSPASEPALALVVSGGHTHLYLARPEHGSWSYSLIGRTLDDAAGEAFDKVAKLLGLGYPGGPWIDALARFGDPLAVPFSFSQIKRKVHLGGKPPRTKAARTAPIANLDPRFLFSFSGIKTAVLRYVELHNLRPEAQARAARLFPAQIGHPELSHPEQSNMECHPERDEAGSKDLLLPARLPATREEALALCPQPVLDLIASFQHAVVGDLMKKTLAAAESLGARRILITGGVAANRELRQRFTAEAARRNLRASHPERSINGCHPERPGAQRWGVEGPPVAFEPAEGSLRFVVSFPTLALSTDNAAMIAAAAWPRLLSSDFAPPELSADPSLALGG
jgi:N6-L-threonylcarbamoyladenine synthase